MTKQSAPADPQTDEAPDGGAERLEPGNLPVGGGATGLAGLGGGGIASEAAAMDRAETHRDDKRD